jgi:heme A synthase
VSNALPPDQLRELALFRRLAIGTVLTTFLLVIVGGVVRVSDSGLGCGKPGSGTEGWPLCGGRVIPFVHQHAVVEFSHRFLAAVVVVLIGLLLWRALRGLRGERWLVRGAAAAAVLVIVQAVLGGLTVEKNLKDVLVAAHLGTAMLLLGSLIFLAWASGRRLGGEPGDATAAGTRGMRRLAALGCVLVLATIVVGGYIAGTEEEGAVNGAGGGAHLACGDHFPTCNDSLLPFGENRLVDIQLTHRVLMTLTTLTLLALIGLTHRRQMGSPFTLLGAILICQVLLGAINVWAGKHPGLVVAHLTLGTTLWAVTLIATLRLQPARPS